MSDSVVHLAGSSQNIFTAWQSLRRSVDSDLKRKASQPKNPRDRGSSGLTR